MTTDIPDVAVAVDDVESLTDGTPGYSAGYGTKTLFSWSRIRQGSFSVADQFLSVGGMFLVNLALARTQSKGEYGVFALSYSIYTFLSSLHNAAILETYTVYGSGRYQHRFPIYSGLLWRANHFLALGLGAAITLVWLLLASAESLLASRTVLGMALACGILLTAAFVRRTFYIRRRPDLAAKFSLVFFVSCASILWIFLRAGLVNGFSAFLITALSWCIAGVSTARELPRYPMNADFRSIAPRYWSEHWKYGRWVFVTAFVFQFLTVGYFWLAAAFLSVRDVGDLRAMYNLVVPIDQFYAAVALLILPKMCSRYALRGIAGLMPLWKAYCSGWFLASLAFSLVVSLTSKPILHVIYAGRFDDIAPLMAILAFLPTVMSVGNTLNGALKATERPSFVFLAYVCSATSTLIFGIPLITHFGLRGAVYGMLTSGAFYTLALAIAFAYQMKKHVPIPAVRITGRTSAQF